MINIQHYLYKSKIVSGMVVLGSQGTSIENKGFFFLKVRKFKKMAVFDSWTFGPT